MRQLRQACGGMLAAVVALVSPHAVAAPASTSQAGPEVGPTLQELPPQRLAKGQCALAVWTLSDRRRVFMTLNNPAVGKLQINGATREVPRQGQAGAVVYGHAEHQTFAGDDITLTLDVVFDPDRRLLGGAMIRQGTLELRAASGWATMMPVGGLVACEP